MSGRCKIFLVLLVSVVWMTAFLGCPQQAEMVSEPAVPRGYVPMIAVEIDDRIVQFGPFVGYYFKPQTPDNLEHLSFICLNERSFYTRDLPENTLLFQGDAILTHLADVGFRVPADNRINPVFFSDAPAQWLESRPAPKDAFLHFHSCYDSNGSVLTGYWFQHKSLKRFTYDMGGRVRPSSPLFHQVDPGVDKHFARIMEFDRGPE